ncbi:MAG: hypothetical protein KDH96_10945 [Candidatus Riesia sp.]|nr:hypothetical protein [Candidatus Riesia sp.]
MRAFLEKINDDWLDDFVFMSKYPLMERGYDVVPFDGDDLDFFDKVRPTKEDICIGSVQVTEAFFSAIDIKLFNPHVSFEELLKVSHREVTRENH